MNLLTLSPLRIRTSQEGPFLLILSVTHKGSRHLKVGNSGGPRPINVSFVTRLRCIPSLLHLLWTQLSCTRRSSQLPGVRCCHLRWHHHWLGRTAQGRRPRALALGALRQRQFWAPKRWPKPGSDGSTLTASMGRWPSSKAHVAMSPVATSSDFVVFCYSSLSFSIFSLVLYCSSFLPWCYFNSHDKPNMSKTLKTCATLLRQRAPHTCLRPTGAEPGRIRGAEEGREEARLLQGVLRCCTS